MTALFINYIFLAIFSTLIIIAAFEDVRRFIIPNWIPASISVLFLLSVLVSHFSGVPLFPSSIWLNLLIFAGVLGFFTILFATGQMGGGDVKLIAAISLWAGPYYVFDFILITALVGGVIASVQLVRNGKTITANTSEKASNGASLNSLEATKTTQQKSVPYGLAIGFGGLFCAQQLFNHVHL